MTLKRLLLAALGICALIPAPHAHAQITVNLIKDINRTVTAAPVAPVPFGSASLGYDAAWIDAVTLP